MDCLFCAIIKGEIPSKKIYEDDNVFAFYDINPLAPIHFLVVPKQHIASADEINEKTSDACKYIFEAIPKIAKLAGVTNGYRVITNIGEDGCQSVKHMHFHVLAGTKLPENLV